jgi:FkbM family methyltransferase
MQSPYLVENRHIAIKNCRHGLFMYSRNDAFVGRGLDLYGEWCDFEIQAMRPHVRPGDTVIDVGANIGTHTVAFANMVGPTGTVHAYEPQRRLFQMLSGNVALNALERVYCHQAAVGDAMGEIHLPPLPPPEMTFNFSAVSLMPDGSSGGQGGEKVPLVTLDALELTRCSMVKIDVEGMESLVLAGARGLIERCKPIIYVENNDQETSARLAKMLPELGYAGYWSIHPYYDARNFYSNTVDVWQNVVWASNLICAPRGASPLGQPFLGAEDNWHACVQRMQQK